MQIKKSQGKINELEGKVSFELEGKVSFDELVKKRAIRDYYRSAQSTYRSI